MNAPDEIEDHPGKDGLPGGREDNHEEIEPEQPARRPSGAGADDGGGDDDAGGESGEGTQSTGDPNSAG